MTLNIARTDQFHSHEWTTITALHTMANAAVCCFYFQKKEVKKCGAQVKKKEVKNVVLRLKKGSQKCGVQVKKREIKKCGVQVKKRKVKNAVFRLETRLASGDIWLICNVADSRLMLELLHAVLQQQISTSARLHATISRMQKLQFMHCVHLNCELCCVRIL